MMRWQPWVAECGPGRVQVRQGTKHVHKGTSQSVLIRREDDTVEHLAALRIRMLPLDWHCGR